MYVNQRFYARADVYSIWGTCQLEPDIRHAVLGNAGTLIAFRVGAEDASILASEFQPKFEVLDLISLANRDIYLKLMIDGAPSKPFSARSLG